MSEPFYLRLSKKKSPTEDEANAKKSVSVNKIVNIILINFIN